jgi:hypothetical protein
VREREGRERARQTEVQRDSQVDGDEQRREERRKTARQEEERERQPHRETTREIQKVQSTVQKGEAKQTRHLEAVDGAEIADLAVLQSSLVQKLSRPVGVPDFHPLQPAEEGMHECMRGREEERE